MAASEANALPDYLRINYRYYGSEQNTAFFSGLLMRILRETPTFLEAASNDSLYFGTAPTVTKDPTSELTAATRDDTKRSYAAHHSVGATKIPDFNEIYLAYQEGARDHAQLRHRP